MVSVMLMGGAMACGGMGRSLIAMASGGYGGMGRSLMVVGHRGRAGGVMGKVSFMRGEAVAVGGGGTVVGGGASGGASECGRQ